MYISYIKKKFLLFDYVVWEPFLVTIVCANKANEFFLRPQSVPSAMISDGLRFTGKRLAVIKVILTEQYCWGENDIDWTRRLADDKIFFPCVLSFIGEITKAFVGTFRPASCVRLLVRDII